MLTGADLLFPGTRRDRRAFEAEAIETETDRARQRARFAWGTWPSTGMHAPGERGDREPEVHEEFWLDGDHSVATAFDA